MVNALNIFIDSHEDNSSPGNTEQKLDLNLLDIHCFFSHVRFVLFLFFLFFYDRLEKINIEILIFLCCENNFFLFLDLCLH